MWAAPKGTAVAQLDKRNDDFIRMLLDVSGRARPADLHGIDEAQAIELLQAYVAAHPERPLAISDGVLSPAVPTVVEPVPAPVEVPVHEAWAAVPAVPDLGPGLGTPAAGQSPQSEIPSWVYEQPAAPTESSPQQVDPYAVPVDVMSVPVESNLTPLDDRIAEPTQQPAFMDTPFEPAPAESPASAGPAWQPSQEPVPAADDWQGSADAYPEEPVGVFPDEQPLAWYWWLVPLFFSIVGGLIAWLILRKAQPRGARKLLIFGGIVLAVDVLISVLMIVFGLGALMTSSSVGAAPGALGYLTA